MIFGTTQKRVQKCKPHIAILANCNTRHSHHVILHLCLLMSVCPSLCFLQLYLFELGHRLAVAAQRTALLALRALLTDTLNNGARMNRGQSKTICPRTGCRACHQRSTDVVCRTRPSAHNGSRNQQFHLQRCSRDWWRAR